MKTKKIHKTNKTNTKKHKIEKKTRVATRNSDTKPKNKKMHLKSLLKALPNNF